MHKLSSRGIIVLTFLMVGMMAKSQQTLDHADPPLWWTGMKNPELMLTLHGDNIGTLEPNINYPGVVIHTVTRTSNPNYLFVNLRFDENAQPGTLLINMMSKKKTIISHPYELRARKTGSAERAGFGPADVVYLLMPDRFSNGDISNDSKEELSEKANRSNPDGRHGGDIQGIIDRLDYLNDLGITAIWTTPLLEDNLPQYSYHTYATTDYFKVDARYGTNDDYARLADECHKRGIKLIMDMVPNHCATEHWWMKDLPMADWVHQFPEFTRTNYTIATTTDPHVSEADKMLSEKGWFDVTMADLNQNNPLVINYFKQFAIFWMEFANLDGIRVDTYPYNDKWKIAQWTKAIREEYPDLNLVGECWQHNPAEIAYWQTGVNNYDGYDSYLPVVMDFPLSDALMSAPDEDNQGWNGGAMKFYNVFVLDYLYANSNYLMTFIDNHDMPRFSTQMGFDQGKYKLALTHLLTARGIPQIYYGTEIMMGGDKNKGDGDIRQDFPGGWPGDQRNAFTSAGRTDKENEAFNYMRSLLKYRKENSVLHDGRMVHFIPRDNVYVYFRMNEEKTVMVVLNNSSEKKVLDVARFDECLKGKSAGKDIIKGTQLSMNDWTLDAKSAWVVELEK